MKKKSVGRVLLLEVAVILVVFVCLFLMSGGAGELYTLLYFLDLPSLFCLVLFTVPSLFASGMAPDFSRAFSIGKKPHTIAEMKRSLEAVKMVQRLVLCGAAFSTLIATVVMLHQLDDLGMVGPSVAVMVLSLFYGVIAEFLLIPLKAHVQNFITDAMDVPEEMEFANAKLVTDDEDEEG